MLQNQSFVEYSPNGPVNTGRVIAPVGKAPHEFFLLEFNGKVPFRRVYSLANLANFAFFANPGALKDFLAPPPAPKAAPGATAAESPATPVAAASPEPTGEEKPAPAAEPTASPPVQVADAAPAGEPPEGVPAA